MTFTIQVFGADSGAAYRGVDEDYEADTLTEARQIAAETFIPGCRPSLILDESGRIVGEFSR